MPERTTLLQANQLGVESTPGVAVAANRKLEATAIQLQPQLNIGTFRPRGNKFPTLTLPGSEWVGGDLEGRLSYTDLVYLASSVLGTAPAPTQPDAVNAPSVYSWLFEPAPNDPSDPVTYTVEAGDSVRAHRAAFVAVTDLSFEFVRSAEDGIELGGSVIGRALEDGVAMTAAPTTVVAQPILPQHWSVYADATSAALGTTKLTRVLQLGVNIEGRWGPLWTVDRAVTSFAELLETEPTWTVKLMVAADAAGMDWLARARAGDTRFLRLEAVGPVAEDVQNHQAVLDVAAKVSAVQEFSDEDGVYAIGFEFVPVDDAAWGKALSLTVQTTVDAL